ncbi:MAG TPA: biotin--[acetyl-CoA-carboxylase] ligase [Micromonosporaceae bacterium]
MRGSPYTDLDRPPLREAALRAALLVPGGLWTDLRVVPETGSTNADVAAAAQAGTPEGLVIVAERQSAGRGRLGRRWESPPRAGLAFSVLLRPAEHGVPAARLGWLPLLTGVALATAVSHVAGVDATVKWPNDLLVDDRKCGGILAEAAGRAVVVGTGLNVTLRRHELPRPDATSLALAGASGTDRDPLLRALLRTLESAYLDWCDAAGDAEACGLLAVYRMLCATLGRTVRVHLPGGDELVGEAVDIDADGHLVVATADGPRPVAAGDVVHVR